MVGGLPSEVYAAGHPPHSDSGIGPHVRHVLDHYLCFLRDVDSGKIDFDDRRREPRIEKDPEYARSVLKRTIVSMKDLSVADSPLRIKMDSDVDGKDAAAWTQTTVDRELQYLVAHTVHHFAIISIIMNLHGIRPGASFGYAPSTLRHRAA